MLKLFPTVLLPPYSWLMDGEIKADECFRGTVEWRGWGSKTSAVMRRKGKEAGLMTGEGKMNDAFDFNLD